MVKHKKSSSSVEARRKKRQYVVPIEKKNPFEIRINRLKHDVIGKKVKTDKGLPGVSRSKANEKRKKTLLKEYKQRNKANTIIDRRFGEFDDSISAEEKMLKRFTLEKQRHHEKSGLYNLENDEEEELTHFGQSLADMNNFDDAGLVLSDEENYQDDNVDTNFGGFLTKKKSFNGEGGEMVPERKLTRQEVMDEIVANSKKKKFERQQTKEHGFELTQQLDTQWKEIQSLLVKRNDRGTSNTQKPDEYDKTVNEMLFEAKTKASDRMKSDEEIVREEKTRLEKLEKERCLRMLGITEDEEAVYHSADAIVENIRKSDNRYEVAYHDGKMIMPEGIDMFGSMKESKDDMEGDDINTSSGDDGDEESADEEGDDVESDHEDIYSDEEKESEETNKKKTKIKDSKEEKKVLKVIIPRCVENEVPYTFNAPSTLKDLLAIMKGRTKDEEILLIFQRIRKCHHIKLEKENQQKIETFFRLLIEYIGHLCKEKNPQLKIINNLAQFIHQVVEDVPLFAARYIQKELQNTFKRITLRIKLKGSTGMFPTLRELVFFKLISLIFPTSDLNHPVTTPCLFMMAMILSKAHFNNTRDVVSGLFLLDIVYDYIKLSKRYLPEVITFIAKLLYQAAPVNKKINKSAASLLNLRKNEQNLLLLDEEVKTGPECINLSTTLSVCCDSSSLEQDDFRLSCINNTLKLTKNLCTLYTDISTYNEVFQPCAALLERLPVERYPRQVKVLLEETLAMLKSKSTEQRAPLTLQSRKPVPLPLLEPQFDNSYEVRSKKRAGDKTQNEREKLKYKLKKETKGAMREIRKDTHFLAKEKLKETLERDASRQRKVKELENALANERQEIREMEKGSRKKKTPIR